MDGPFERVLSFPLYHGTNAIFVSSIRAERFGAVNPNEAIGTSSLLERLVKLGDHELAANEHWQLKKVVAKNMVQQHTAAGGMSFKYGKVFLSPSRMTAACYATSNRYGSEQLSTALEILELISGRRLDEAEQIEKEYPRIGGLNGEASPVVVKVDRIRVEDLETESGGDPYETAYRICNLRATMPPEMWEILFQQFNFQAKKAIPPDRLEFFAVVKKGNGFRPEDFEYTPYG